jgi:hypothetical protein
MLLSRDELYAPLVHLKLHSTYNEMPLSKKMLHENTFHGESSDVCRNKHAMGVRRVCVSPWMRACIVSPQPVIEGVEEHVKCVCGVVAHPF